MDTTKVDGDEEELNAGVPQRQSRGRPLGSKNVVPKVQPVLGAPIYHCIAIARDSGTVTHKQRDIQLYRLQPLIDIRYLRVRLDSSEYCARKTHT